MAKFIIQSMLFFLILYNKYNDLLMWYINTTSVLDL